MGTLKLKASLPSLTLCGVGLSVLQVNGQNVVKVGHRQVVNMIRQGGNTLMVKVVMVTRHPDMDEAVHKKGASPLICVARPGHPIATRLRSSEALMASWSPPLAFPSPRLLVHDPSEGVTEGGRAQHGGGHWSLISGSTAVVVVGSLHGTDA